MTKTFNHVDEIWEALDACETAEQAYEILDSIPRKFGTWWADVVAGELEVTNQWWDESQQDMMIESRTFEVNLED
jgi:hypothetical protein